MTVRRGINKFSALGIVSLVHGGAVFNVTFRERQMQRDKITNLSTKVFTAT